MSIPVTIFIPKDAPTWTSRDLNAKLASHGFPIQLEDFDPQRQVGVIPAMFDGHRTGFEYFNERIATYLESVEEMKEENDFPYTEDDLQRVRASREVVQLLTHSSARGRGAAVIVAGCIAELTDGWVLDEPVWRWHSSKTAINWARERAAALKPDFESDPPPAEKRMGLKESYRSMGFELAAFSILWFLGGSIGTFFFFTHSQYAQGALSLLMAILAIGMWLGMPWVKVPLLVYWSIFAVAGFALLVMRGWTGVQSIRPLAPIYFVYVISKWRPPRDHG